MSASSPAQVTGGFGSGGACPSPPPEISTVNSRVAGAGSTLPAASVARTLKVQSPPARATRVNGDSQDVHSGRPWSNEHSRVEGSLAENSNVGVGSLVRPSGPESIVVSGGVVSTVKLRVAGVESALPA
jgi:hypothetical protein